MCTNCIPGYYLEGDDCLPCSENCLSCSNSTICESCEIGMYLDGEDCEVCRNVIDNCVACVDVFDVLPQCTDCSLGTYLTGDNTC